MGDENGLSIRFLGGADEIGASCTVVSVEGTTLLVDCGIRFRAGHALPDLAELSGRDLDAVLVTHAHTDHTGGLPVVHEAFPAVPIHMSRPTEDLVRILQQDALRLMAGGWEREGEVPLYTEAAVASMLHVTRGVKHGESFAVGAVEVTYLPASHILGASMVHLATPAGNVLFTGDYSVGAQRTVPALSRPPLPVDLMVTESTYGNRLHSDRKASEQRLVNRVRETLEKGGRVLVPAFAIGRAQEVLLILRQALERGELPDVPIFVDGMVRSVCEVYSRHPRYVTAALAKRMRRGHPFYTDRIRPVREPEERREVLAAGPTVIVSSSGMLSGGPSAFYAGELARYERDAILLTGYQDEESPGRALLRLAEEEGPRTLRIGDREIDVRCSFSTYGLSAHADRMQMVGLIEGLRPECVALVHGDDGAKRSLAGSLGCRDVVHAANGDRIDRRYSGRRRGPPPRRRPIEIELEQARSLLANAPGDVIRIDRLAQAFFGGKAPPILVTRLVRRLEDLGVALRDDHRRGLLRIVSMDPAEEALAEDLKDSNPKGRLLEYLMRRGVQAPAFAAAPLGGGRCRIDVTLELDGRTIESGAHEAGSSRLAEQLAARALLAALEDAEEIVEAEPIDDAEAARLKAENPKGRLLERCAAAGLPFPEFGVRPLADGDFAGTARLGIGGGELLESAPFRAFASKTVEQATARDLIERLPDSLPAGGSGPRTPAEGTDARLLLNRYKQTGQLVDFGYETLETRGPSHRPEFVVRAWVETLEGERLLSEPASAPAKKEAHRRAAEAMVARLRR